MALVVRNTFLEIAEYKFLYSGAPCGMGRRSNSVPKEFKPTATNELSFSKVMSNDASTPRSDLSFHSAMELPSSSASGMDLASEWDWGEHGQLETDVAFNLSTPTASALSSPRHFGHTCFDEEHHAPACCCITCMLHARDASPSLSKHNSGEVETELSAAFDTMTPNSALSSPRYLDFGEQDYACATPTSPMDSPMNSPRCGEGHSLIQDALSFARHSGHPTVPAVCCETERVLCYLTGCQQGDLNACAEVAYGPNSGMKVGSMNPWCDDSNTALSTDMNPEPENEPEILMEAEHVPLIPDSRTRLKVEAPVFQPVTKDTRMEAVVSCIHLALFASGQVHDLKVESGYVCSSTTAISAEIPSGPDACARSYRAMQLAKQSLEAITDRLPTVALLSARVQREDCGYSLRSSIACVPQHAQNCMCWDMFRKGHCPRRSLCRWYHPDSNDIARIRVSIRYSDDASGILEGERLRTDSSVGGHKISLGALVQ